TGPKIRVPRGLFLSCRITAALSSKRMYEPSGRPYSLAWRTMTALTTSPFLTEPPGVASLTDATITSPIEASNFEPPATTRMHISSRAPVLSATRSLVCGMIIGHNSPRTIPFSFRVPGSGFRVRSSGPSRARRKPETRNAERGTRNPSGFHLGDLHWLPRASTKDLLNHPVFVFADRVRLGDDH